MPNCLTPNCRKEAPADDAMCIDHREESAADEIKRLRVALEFYGDASIYSMPIQDMNRHAFKDRGNKARAALRRGNSL